MPPEAGPPHPRHSRAVVRRRQQVAAGSVVILVVAVVAAFLLGGDQSGSPSTAAQDLPASHASATGTKAPARPATRTPAASTTAKPTSKPTAKPTAMRVFQSGSGTLVTVPGSSKAPGKGEVERVRVEIEKGTDVVPADFAEAVLDTLNDDRSWGHGGTRTFARTSGSADIVVILASPATSADLCRPLVTNGRLSCSIGERAILTTYRWARGTPEFDSLAQYRDYVVNHEVGHALGHGHEQCPGAGRRAPVMQQQSKQVAPCTPNAWPYP